MVERHSIVHPLNIQNNVNTIQPSSSQGYCATIGFFDGVHKGHRYLIRQVNELAQQRGLSSMVITFDSHPREVLHSAFCPQLLSTPEEKMALLAKTGIQRPVMLPFTTELAALSAREFMQQVLREQWGVQVLVIGYDNRFGRNRSESFDDYVAYGKEMGIEVVHARPLQVEGLNISSSMVRSVLQEGEMQMAYTCLGYHYSLSGTVTHGEHVGTSLGYPTANIQVADCRKLIPANGVYAVRAMIDGDGRWLQGMTNIGTRPTYGDHAIGIETHLFGYHNDLYGHELTVRFVQRLRDERKFHNTGELVRQLERDALQAKTILEQ